MDPALTWRALEDPEAPPSPASPESPAGTDARRRPSLTTLIVVAVGLVAAVCGAFAMMSSQAPAITLPGDAAASDTAAGSSVRAAPRASPSPTGGVVVDVAGAVAHPGVYRLPAGSRIADAVTAAGGFGPGVDAAATGHLNLAALLRDGDQVLVPSRDGPTPQPGVAAGGPADAASPGSAVATGPLDLNRATEAELDALPGVGPVTVKKIVESRAKAPFASLQDFRTRKLVGEAAFAKLDGLVTVGP